MVQKYIIIRFQRMWRSFKDFILHKLLHTEDPPHKLALGVAIGVFMAFTPTIGIQMILVVAAAWLLRANKAVGLPVVWISNFATAIPIYWICYLVGWQIVGGEFLGSQWWDQLARPPVTGWWPGVQFYWSRFYEILWPLTIGCLIVATILGYITYLFTYYAIRIYRMNRWGQLTPPTPHKRPTEAPRVAVNPDATD